MSHKICPYCGAMVEDLEEHIREHEMELLNKMKEEQKEIMHDMKRYFPDIYINFLEDLSKEENREIKMLCAAEFLSMNEFERAEKVFNSLLDKPDADIYNGLGICYRRMGKNKEALECFKNAMKYGERKISVINICDLYEEEERFEEEEEFLNNLIKKYDDGFLYATYARILIILGKFSLAERIARKAIDLGEEMEGYIQLSFSLIMQGKEKEAEKILLDFNKKYPDKLQPYILLSNLYIDTEPEKAEEYLEKLYEKSIEPFVMEFLITSYIKLGKEEKSEELLEEAIALHKNNANFYVLKGIFLMKRGENEEEAFKKAIKLSSSKDVFIKIADIYIDIGEYEKAIEYVEEAEKLYGKDEIIKCIKGDVFFEMGKFKNALKEYEESLKIKENVDAYLGIIKCYEMAGRYKDVENIYEKLMKEYKNGWLWYYYADFLKNIGKLEESKKICNEALKKFDDNELLNEIEMLLEEIDTHAN